MDGLDICFFFLCLCEREHGDGGRGGRRGMYDYGVLIIFENHHV